MIKVLVCEYKNKTTHYKITKCNGVSIVECIDNNVPAGKEKSEPLKFKNSQWGLQINKPIPDFNKPNQIKKELKQYPVKPKEAVKTVNLDSEKKLNFNFGI